MKQLFTDLRCAMRAFFSSYLLMLLPASALGMFLFLGAGQLEDPRFAENLTLGYFFILYTLVPAIALGGRGQPFAKIAPKVFTLSFDAFAVIACALLISSAITPETSLQIFVAGMFSGLLFLAGCTLLLRALRILPGATRQSLLRDLATVWKAFPGLMFRMFIGLVPAIITILLLDGIQPLLRSLADGSSLFILTVINLVAILPISFLPFFVIAAGLQGLPEPKD